MTANVALADRVLTHHDATLRGNALLRSFGGKESSSRRNERRPLAEVPNDSVDETVAAKTTRLDMLFGREN
jgi:hypothetical protein